MTWQIVKRLAPENKPDEWVSSLEKINLDSDIMWPFRTHKHVPDMNIPAVYTYRHPIEAWLSFRSRFEQDKELALAEADAFIQIGAAWEVGRRYEQDMVSGRHVLFLKYEDHYDDRETRIRQIAEFMSVPLPDEKLQDILDWTSLDINIERGRAVYKAFPERKFGDGASALAEIGGMQRLHVNEKTMGIPGVWLKAYPKFVKIIKDPVPGSAFEALRDMCHSLGYEV